MRFWNWLKSLFVKKPAQPVIKPSPVTPAPVDDRKFDLAPWMRIAYGLRSLNWKEIRGSKNNANIVGAHQYTSLKAKNDETAWCSSILNKIMIDAGYKGTRSAAALSWKTYGKAVSLNEIRFGDILVADYGNGHGHVTLFDHWDGPNAAACLGGNQSNDFNITVYPKSRIAYARRPV